MLTFSCLSKSYKSRSRCCACQSRVEDHPIQPPVAATAKHRQGPVVVCSHGAVANSHWRDDSSLYIIIIIIISCCCCCCNSTKRWPDINSLSASTRRLKVTVPRRRDSTGARWQWETGFSGGETFCFTNRRASNHKAAHHRDPTDWWRVIKSLIDNNSGRKLKQDISKHNPGLKSTKSIFHCLLQFHTW